MSCCLKIMADDELNAGEFWLPPRFLSQDHDEDDFLTKFTQRLAHSSTINDPWIPNYEITNRSWNIATSPQSTLCNVIGDYRSKEASSRGSPNCLSPPYEETMNNNMEATELLYAAAEEVTKLQQRTGTAFFHFCDPPEKSFPKQHFKQQQSMKKKQKGYVQYMQQAQRDETRTGISTGPAPSLSSSACPTLKKSQCPEQPTPAGSGMRAVFLGNQVTKSKRSGTGVFLPRPAGSWNNPSPGYSTVLLPERVVQALNLNSRTMDTPQQLKKNGAALKHRENVVSAHAQQRWDVASSKVTNNELQLPQEWTY